MPSSAIQSKHPKQLYIAVLHRVVQSTGSSAWQFSSTSLLVIATVRHCSHCFMCPDNSVRSLEIATDGYYVSRLL